MNKSILVLGGAGFLGSQLIASLLNHKFYRVASADVLTCDADGVNNHIVDVFDKDKLSDICYNYDIIINCTGQITKPINLSFKLNTQGVTNIAEICAEQNKKVLHFSTITVYGSTDFADENTALNPETSYASFKAVSEFIVTKIISSENLIVLRLSNLYGVNQPKGILGYIYKSFKSDKKLEFNNDGKMLRYFQNTTDAAENIIRILQQNEMNGIYNLPGNERLSISELVALTENITGIKFDVNYQNTAPFENITEIDSKKIRESIGLNYYSTLSSFIEQNFK